MNMKNTDIHMFLHIFTKKCTSRDAVRARGRAWMFNNRITKPLVFGIAVRQLPSPHFRPFY